MKHVLTINELFGHRKLFNKEEDVAIGILDSMSKMDTESIKKEDTWVVGSTYKAFVFKIDGFDIKSVCKDIVTWGAGSAKYRYFLYTDDVQVDCSNYIAKKIWKKAEVDQHRYLKKDVRINFVKRK